MFSYLDLLELLLGRDSGEGGGNPSDCSVKTFEGLIKFYLRYLVHPTPNEIGTKGTTDSISIHALPVREDGFLPIREK